MPLVNPIISKVAPLKVGGSANAGAGLLASAFDHVHPLTETSGPTNMALGAIADKHLWQRIGNEVLGRLLHINRLSGSVATNATALSDVGAPLSVALGIGEYSFAFVVFYETALTTTGLMLAVNFSGGTAVRYRYGVMMGTGAGAMYCQESGTLDFPLGSAGVGPGNIGRMALVFGRLEVTAPGTLALRYASGVAGSNVTITNQSHMLVVQQQ